MLHMKYMNSIPISGRGWYTIPRLFIQNMIYIYNIPGMYVPFQYHYQEYDIPYFITIPRNMIYHMIYHMIDHIIDHKFHHIWHDLVGGLEHFLFFHILGIVIPSDVHIFQRGCFTTNQILYTYRYTLYVSPYIYIKYTVFHISIWYTIYYIDIPKTWHSNFTPSDGYWGTEHLSQATEFGLLEDFLKLRAGAVRREGRWAVGVGQNHGKTIGKPWENMDKHGQTMRNIGETMEKQWKTMGNHGATIGNTMENIGETVQNHGKQWKAWETPWISRYQNLSPFGGETLW